MKRLFTLVVSVVFTATAFFAHAQDELAGSPVRYDSYEGFYFGGGASTNGWGFNARYAFNNWFSLKTGFETLSFSYNFDFDEYDIDYNADLNYKTGGVLLLADYVSNGNGCNKLADFVQNGRNRVRLKPG